MHVLPAGQRTRLKISDIIPGGAAAIDRETMKMRDLLKSAPSWRTELGDPAVTPEQFRKIMKNLNMAAALARRLPSISLAMAAEKKPFGDFDRQLAAAGNAAAELDREIELCLSAWRALPDERAAELAADAQGYRHFLRLARHAPWELTLCCPDYTTCTGISLEDSLIKGSRHGSRPGVAGKGSARAQQPATAAKRAGSTTPPGPELARAWKDRALAWPGPSAKRSGNGPDLLRARELAWGLPPGTLESFLNVARREGPGTFGRYLKDKAAFRQLKRIPLAEAAIPFLNGQGITIDMSVKATVGFLYEFWPEMAYLARQVYLKGRLSGDCGGRGYQGPMCVQPLPGKTPLVLIDWEGRVADSLALAHMLGQAAQALMAPSRTPLSMRAADPLRELGGGLAEALLPRSLNRQDNSDLRRTVMIGGLMDRMVANVYIPAITSCFEREAHLAVSRGGDVDEISDIFLELNREMLGNFVEVTDKDRWAWIANDRISRAPYDCAEALGTFAGFGLARMWEKKGQGFAEAVANAFSRIGSAPADKIMKEAGVSLASDRFWKGGFIWLNKIMDFA
ncbi:MAG: hypothetical protein LBT40_01265 [Deltaproteobacteria bacterium]|jgi:hypothetical protein|nr:hypothetical protein [Deltaproteobacteria bacterium]